MRKRVTAKISPRNAVALAKVLDAPTSLRWHKVKFDRNDKLIVAAVRVADPPARSADEFRADVASALCAIAEADVNRPKVRDVKEAAAVYAAAMRRLRDAWKPDLLPQDLMVNPVTLAELIAQADEIAKPSPERTQRPVEVKRDAAMHAFVLLEKHGLDIKGTKGSKYCKLAAVLAGHRGDDMTRHCMNHIRQKRAKGTH